LEPTQITFQNAVLSKTYKILATTLNRLDYRPELLATFTMESLGLESSLLNCGAAGERVSWAGDQRFWSAFAHVSLRNRRWGRPCCGLQSAKSQKKTAWITSGLGEYFL